MSPLQIMELKKGEFTPNEMTIYETIRTDPKAIVSMTTSLLAKECGVSQPAITRFVKSLGYGRFQDFRTALIYELSSTERPDPDSSAKTGLDAVLSSESGLSVPDLSNPQNRQLQEIISQLLECQNLFSSGYMTRTARYLAGFRRIYTTGLAKSYQPAELFEILSRKLNRRIHAVRFDFLNEVCDYLGPEDLLIVFSVSASSEVIPYISSTQAKVMLVTANPNPECQKHIDRLVVFPAGKGNPEDIPVSPVLFDIFVDILVKTMLQSDKKPE